MSTPHPVFTPTDVPGERLDEITIGRVEVIDRLVQRVRDIALTANRPHTLVVGPRGSGKTHLLTLALWRARQDPAVDARLAVAQIAEDAVGIGSYPDLLVDLIRNLDPSRAEAARALRRGKQTVALEQLLTTATGDRAVVLVLENMDRVFDAIGLAGQRSLRAFVETSGRVAIFGSTPLLSKDFSSRSQPWFGAFDSEFLDDLSVADGTALLARVAREQNDADLASFVTGTRGQERLQAIAALAGGSPRIWHVLSGCVSVQALDELIPAVRALLEQLTPYYQQRLWELAATEQRVVVELARQLGGVTVTDLSEESGVDRATLANSLKRLGAAGWVTDQKWPGTDQRTTYYDLREPLLRHHLQYREAHGGALDLIVDLLRAFFTSHEREKMLGTDVLGPQAELHLARSLSGPARSDSPYAERDVTKLRAWVRRWTSDPSLPRELIGSTALAAKVLHACEASDADAIGRALDELAACTNSHDHDLIELYAACWNGAQDPVRARDRLLVVRGPRGVVDNALNLQIREERAFWTGEAGDPVAARDLYAALIADRTHALGPDHPDTLGTRHNHANWTGEAGDPAAARDLFAALIPDLTRILGPDHPHTLTTRHNHAYWTGQAGDLAAARDLFAALLPDRTRILGPDHPDTLTTRHSHAYYTGQAGDPAAARDLYAALLADRTRILGTDHPDTLTTRHNHASFTAEAGDPATARDLYAPLIADRTSILGPDHPNTLAARHSHAYWTGQAGDPTTARDLFAALVPDALRKNGPANLILAAVAGLDTSAARTGKPGLLAEILDSIAGEVPNTLLLAVAPRWVGSALTTGRSLAVASAALGATELTTAIAIAGRSQAAETLVRWIDSIPRENRAAAVLNWVTYVRMTDIETKRLVAAAHLDDAELIERVAAARNGDAVARAGLPREIGAILDAQTA